ncbi:WD40-repeat-containing domain protein [Dunaliella salina]|uniref:WD40-repeat-containing domain protein n=1 Tax=Dunaliella salina TaxID=3046 RepID=A0ABQ7FW59_DUNSA|nr:WD40-repeat-containing domain protein [Dunaliella salina]|eukprot:KAF5826437.1 WD40-repeat-containing domain protein [Dunaliella salina]
MGPRFRQACRVPEPPPKHSAAHSHVRNDQYMDDWEKAYKELEALSCGDPTSQEGPAPIQGRRQGLSLAQQIAQQGSRSQHEPAAPRARTSMAQQLEQQNASPHQFAMHRAHQPERSSKTSRGPVRNAGKAPERCPPAVTRGWTQGPVDPQGILCDLSDRPNMCSAACWDKNEVVIGSSDHALYVVDAEKGTLKRTLYNKTNGHTEWVTCCTYTGSGHIVSGGMDSKLWVWPGGGVRGVELQGHAGPVSQVAWDESSGLVASAGYDKTIRLWDVGGRGREVACLAGHVAPVLEMVPQGGLIASGDRSGNIIVWDTASGAEAWRLKKKAHDGHVTALEWWDAGDPAADGCFVSGGQDGCVRVWDPRQHTLVAKMELHVNDKGRGAAGDVCAGGSAAGGMLVSAGADGTLAITDPRTWGLVKQIRLSNFPYSMMAAGGLALVGLGDGSLWVIQCSSGKVFYCLGANKHAVRCLEATYDKLVTSGDDGNMVLYHFN